jgi:hypothetical protein
MRSPCHLLYHLFRAKVKIWWSVSAAAFRGEPGRRPSEPPAPNRTPLRLKAVHEARVPELLSRAQASNAVLNIASGLLFPRHHRRAGQSGQLRC